MKTLLSINARPDGGCDVIYDEDGNRYACEIYDIKEPQQFSWAELTFALANNLLPRSFPALIDKRTPEEITADRIAEIKSMLKIHDAEVTRIVEDLVAAVTKTPEIPFVLDPTKAAIITKKEALRAELALLV